MNVKIGSFNCLNFGKGSSNTGKAAIIAKIIRSEQFDIIALQEIKGQQIVNDIILALNCGIQKGGKWVGCADGEVNDYAFIWNSQNIGLPKTKSQNGNIRVFYPHIYKQYGRDPELGKISFARPPFYGRFQTRFVGLPNFEIRLINTHIRFSKGKDGEELAASASEVALRRFEFQALTRNIYYRISDKIYGRAEGQGLPSTAYTILLGDYNMNLSESKAGYPSLGNLESVEIINVSDPSKNKIIVTEQTELTTLKKQNEKYNNSEVIYANNYDHITYDKNRFGSTSRTISRIDSIRKYCNNDPELHIKKLSDHTPIKMIFSIKEEK